MKELSIEEKAKRYDDALTKARNIVNSINVGLIGKDSFEAVFPELAESDDERVRKGLIELVKQSSEILEKKNQEQMIDWLEKQGQKQQGKSALKAIKEEKSDNQNCVKPATKVKLKFKVGDKVIGIISGIQYYIIKVCDNHYCTESGCIIMFCAQDNFELVEQQLKEIEQKPTDEEMKTLLQTEYEKGRADAISEMQKSWSEEDEEMLGYALDMIEWYSGKNEKRVRLVSDWLKSLKDRVQPQQEWNEEDENKLLLLEALCDDQINGSTPNSTMYREMYELKDWLKSLRPQPKWKPSEEQIIAINTAINVLGKGTLSGKQLIELQEQLKN